MDKPPYLTLLEKTQAAAALAPEPGSPEEAAALDRFRAFFENMTPARVSEIVDSVYAEDGWLYDTLVLHHGIAEIRPYFIKTAERAAGVRVEILDVLRKGADFYIKWSMEIDWSSYKKGKTTTSYGMSHLRFNQAGKVVMHYDFWDAANGFFEHLPVVGALIRWIKRRV
ncbi:MAG TPA: nuclear transport factor 2 family protein [Oceanipulchritudo sp.]|nr:nuclear transport factor 2 family protein [Oceanipulchritudo sp.]